MSFALRVDPFAPAKEEDFRQDLNVRLTCPDCGPVNPSLIEEFGSGDLVCGNCGKQSILWLVNPRVDDLGES